MLGEQHPDYATSLDNLAGFYNRQGKVAKAEPLLLIALSIRKKVLGEEHPDYANSLNNLAGFYAEQGNAEKAEPLYLEALSIRKKVLGETHPDYIVSLNNLAGFYNGQGKVAKAEPLLLIALSIRKKVLGEEHPDYANSLNNLAVHYFGQGNIQKAEPLYLEALSIRKKILGETHPDCALSLDNLAGFYNYLGRVEEAEPLFLEALSIRKKVLGEEHPDYFNSIESLAEFYYSKDDPTDAYKYYLLYPKYYKMEIHERLSFFSEEELNAYLKKALSGRDFFYSFIYEYPNRYDSLNIGAWQTESMLKCMILRNQQRVQETIENSRDTSLIALRDKYVDNKKQIGYWYSQPIDSRPANLKETEDQAEKQEKELTRKSEAFSKEIKLLNTSWSDVQQKLLKNEAAIEFVSFVTSIKIHGVIVFYMGH
ncbi:MAG: tetratricopeptide repeat protein [Bacteroidetes bacterium]|nr:tetratricopeptide repeat protein [Bacteroidota bacterium]